MAININPSDPFKNQKVKDPTAVSTVDASGNPSDGKIKTGAVGTPEGAYNPYTKGFEEVNPTQGVNTGAYSVKAKADLAKSYGYDPGKVSMNDFQRNVDGSLGIKLPKLSTAPSNVPSVGGQPANGNVPATGTQNANAGTSNALPTLSNVGKTGIGMVDTEIGKLQTQRDKDIKAAENSYIIGKSKYETNKGYYSNFDATDKTFQGIMADRRSALSTSPDGSLSDAQAQQIANKYGVSVDSVKNPNKVWDSLIPTEEGKSKLGITNAEKQIGDLTTDFERKKEDAATSLKRTTENINNNIDDVKTQLDRTTKFMSATGAWSGAARSSGYLTGIDNVKDDGNKTVSRLGTMLENARSDNATYIKRLTEDYEKAIGGAKTEFDDKLSELKSNAGTQMSALAEQYGIGNDSLTKALQTIEDSFHTKTLETMNKYISNVKSINDITNANMDQAMQVSKFQEDRYNNRYNQYLANDGAALAGSSFASLSSDVASGKLSLENAVLLKSAMLSSIKTTLEKNGSTVNADDQNVIEHMLSTGSTPSQVVAAMRGHEKFAVSEAPKLTTIGNKQYFYNANTGSYDKVKESEGAVSPSQVSLNEKGVVSFTPEAESEMKKYGVNTALLAIPNGTVRTNRKNAEQCGAYANDVLGEPGLFGNKLSEKPVNSQVPEIGSAIVMDIKDKNGNSVNENGHVGIVVGINGTVLTIKSSNVKGDGAITTDYLDLADPKNVDVKGYYSKTGTSVSEPQATDKALFDKVLSGKATEADYKQIQSKGWTDEDINKYAKSKPASTALSDDQRSVWNSATSKFSSDPQVKAFEETVNQWQTLKTSVEQQTGPGDIAAVFNFMKALDPASTVREGEFALAAGSTGLASKAKMLFQKAINGESLTEDQRNQFLKIAEQYAKNRARVYDRKYDDMKRVMKNNGISEEYLPTPASDIFKEEQDNPAGI